MSQVAWSCPHCGLDLTCPPTDFQSNLSCPECGGVSCPEECLRLAAMALASSFARQEEREFRQMLREFRAGLREAYEDELQQLLAELSNLAVASAGTEAAQYVEILCDEVEGELEARVNETGWDEAKRLARRGTQATKEWLKTDNGKAVAGGVAVIAALLGFDYLSE